MKRVKKRKNFDSAKRIDFKLKFVTIVLVIVYLACAIQLKNYNTSLNLQLKEKQKANDVLTKNNQTLRLKIDDLKSFERMSAIASKSGLKNREGAIKNVQ